MASCPNGENGNSKNSSSPLKSSRDNRFIKEDEDRLQNTSGKKFKSADRTDIVVNPIHVYRIVEFFSVFGSLTEFLICKSCKKDVKFVESGVEDFGFKILLTCSCGSKEINSCPMINTGYEINSRIVLVMKLLGIGREGINIFSSLMDIGRGIGATSYDVIMNHLHTAATSIFDSISKEAVKEEKELNASNGRPVNDLKVSVNGLWKNREISFIYNVTTIIGYYTGKVLDLIVKRAYCSDCMMWKQKKGTKKYIDWYERHQKECFANRADSESKMEVEAIKDIFSRSEEKFGVKYVNYIGDKDSKIYKSILELNPYGNDCPITTSEAIGDIEKRMETRLRNIAKEKELREKGILNDVLIKKLTKYYGLAIRRNISSVEDMKKAIMGTLDHLSSTNKEPKHETCPVGKDSWCRYRKSKAAGKTYDHPPSLDADVLEYVRPIYEEFSNDDLLTKCLGCNYSQNSNETFNSSVWRLAPKHFDTGANIIEIASYIAGCVFNEGYNSVLLMMNSLGINIGSQAQNFVRSDDEKRFERQQQRILRRSKEARAARKMKTDIEDEFYEKVEGLLYVPEIAD